MDRMRSRSWEELIRKTKAHELLKEGRHDDISIQDLAAATDAFLRRSLVGFPREKIKPRPTECYDTLFYELSKLHKELYVYEVGLIACLPHLLQDDASKLLTQYRQIIQEDRPSFKDRMEAYLRLLLVIRPIEVIDCTDDCEIAINDLLKIIVSNSREYDRFPSVTRVLYAFKNPSFEELVSVELLDDILIEVGYKECLPQTIVDLYNRRRWHELHGLVEGLERVPHLAHVQKLTGDLFPNIGLLMSWKPNRGRIRLWEANIDESLGIPEEVSRIIALEGPDYKGFRSTIRCSDHLQFRQAVQKISQRNSVDILDHLLCVFDKAVAKDASAIELCAKVCAPENLKPPALARVDACITLLAPIHLQHMRDFLLPFKGDESFEQLQIVSNGLEVFRTNPQLQRAFEGIREKPTSKPVRELARRAVSVLVTGQNAFSKRLGSGSPNRPFADRIAALGRTLLISEWLHKHLDNSFLDRLGQIPSDVELNSWFQQIDTPNSRTQKKTAQNLLDKRLCAMTRPGESEAPASVLPIGNQSALNKTLDRHRQNLRVLLIDTAAPGLPDSNVVACIEQSLLEHETFIDSLCDKLEAISTDRNCFDLVRFLGKRCKPPSSDVPPLAQCWRDLLIHVLRRREPDLLERWADNLSPSDWKLLTENLLLIYNGKFIDRQSDLRFTAARFSVLASRRVGIGPRASVRTNSTGSTQ